MHILGVQHWPGASNQDSTTHTSQHIHSLECIRVQAKSTDTAAKSMSASANCSWHLTGTTACTNKHQCMPCMLSLSINSVSEQHVRHTSRTDHKAVRSHFSTQRLRRDSGKTGCHASNVATGQTSCKRTARELSTACKSQNWGMPSSECCCRHG